jgi:hypothetical protein
MADARDKLVALGGDYFDCDEDREELTHDDPLSALEDYVDGSLRPNMSPDEIRDAILGFGTVTVHAFAHLVVSEKEIVRAVDGVIDHLDERWSEEYGDPDGDHHINVDKERLEAVVRAAYAASPVWRCEESGKVELTADEVLEIMRAERPDWFEVAT